MRLRHAVFLAMATGLAGCATDPHGLRYSDGNYYSGAGGGDYFVGRDYDHRRHAYDPFFDPRFGWLYHDGPWHGGWYGGSPFPGYGYCSVRYRYCPRGWADPFPRYDVWLYFDQPWYRDRDPRWRPPRRQAPDAPRREPIRHAPRDPMTEDGPDARGDASPRARRGTSSRRDGPPKRRRDAGGDCN